MSRFVIIRNFFCEPNFYYTSRTAFETQPGEEIIQEFYDFEECTLVCAQLNTLIAVHER